MTSFLAIPGIKDRILAPTPFAYLRLVHQGGRCTAPSAKCQVYRCGWLGLVACDGFHAEALFVPALNFFSLGQNR